MASLLTAEHRAYIGRQSEPITVEVSRRDIVRYAIATEQTEAKYLRGDEAPPMFVFNLLSIPRPIAELGDDGLPRGRGEGGPRLPLARVMAGGTELTMHRPIRPGDRLTGTSQIVEMLEKQGSQGPLIFTVRELRVVDAEGNAVFEERQTSIAR